jgi:GNAT superfamily N-acetyltransferase
MSVQIRPAVGSDSEACGKICYAAFRGISEHHRFPPDFPTPEYAVGVIRALIDNPSVFGVVAESDGRIVGSNFLDERDAIRGVGPISVDPEAQGSGIGRRLMEAVIERGEDADGVRLLQDSHNAISLSLYASLGFEVKEPIVLMSGTPASRPPRDVEVQPLQADQLEQCGALCKKVHGFERTNSLRDSMQFSPHVALRGARMTAYASSLSAWPIAHGVAETEEDMRALILGTAASDASPVSLLVPVRQGGLFRWCLSEGLRAVKAMNLMAIGGYHEPQGCWFPSVLY